MIDPSHAHRAPMPSNTSNTPWLTRLGLLLCLLFGSQFSSADSQFTTFGDYSVLHTVFNSTFLQPEVATAYNLTRGKGQSLLNVALIKSTDGGNSKGLPAKVSGSITNLMQQQRTLEFIEIKEQDAVYYLAPIRVSNNDEVVHFKIEVTHDGNTYPVTFSKKLYKD
ncbi:DUF4426 domain-containing protein [Aestuariicella sp. G3-2]|uniref:DUF4426 domain-containing protein n=1 Tax=Pseudomaricurvus albidus TaxID=2842452 RepID=UPI001C0E6048|nr:DUF4426 domain-containing protein [Aestuariicella albida]MBU3068503.1 DUF4426 domain-containing protein [Aestuariicella albida]